MKNTKFKNYLKKSLNSIWYFSTAQKNNFNNYKSYYIYFLTVESILIFNLVFIYILYNILWI